MRVPIDGDVSIEETGRRVETSTEQIKKPSLRISAVNVCELRTEGQSTPIGSGNPSHACVDGIKGQLRGRFIIWLWAMEEVGLSRAEHVWVELIWACSEWVSLGRGSGPLFRPS
ncbi:hypothetical protein HYC85_029498 [Camellia sinensis]|uniref:Uncharacterized protein n=1 Tax=Camellia sinensis TaxID=4442 RepID=A0A7J7FYT6_CAMSI|nr:hypothetical protein HYC85_029498 [Camellia sinensis]